MRFSLARLVGAIALIFGAMALVLAAMGLWLWALYLYASRYLPSDLAAITTGFVTFIAAGVLLWVAKRLNR